MSGDAPGDVAAGVSGSDTDAPPPVDVSDLSVSFGDLDAGRDVDLTVEHGEIVCLVGPNGAGKTTLIRAIKGTLDPDAGTVRLAGDRVTAL
ncbi:ATP-binding cassette domain-containing protein, partial [Halorubrum tibetense]